MMKQQPLPHPAWRALDLALATETAEFNLGQGYWPGSMGVGSSLQWY
jgi:hypothetical protein